LQYILAHFKPRYPELREMSLSSFAPEFREALETDSPEVWGKLLREVHPGVFSFSMFNEEWCNKLIEEVDHFDTWAESVGLHVNRPNSMNVSHRLPWPPGCFADWPVISQNFGCVLDDMGLNDVLQRLTTDVLNRMAVHLFDESTGTRSLDS
jgi:hypothetical protein